MGLRGVLALVGALAGGAGLSQFPEFSQQYLQRLAGQVDALAVVASNFDASAARNGLTRDQALAQVEGNAFLTDHQGDLRSDFARYEKLTSDLALLRAATPLERLVMPHRLGDRPTFEATLSDYKPAVPVTQEGLITTGIGAALGYGLVSLLLSLLGRIFLRRRLA